MSWDLTTQAASSSTLRRNGKAKGKGGWVSSGVERADLWDSFAVFPDNLP